MSFVVSYLFLDSVDDDDDDDGASNDDGCVNREFDYIFLTCLM
jgi:hypothetical protein